MSMIPWIAAGLIALKLCGELVLAALNRAEVRRHEGRPPPAVAAIVDEATFAKSVSYTRARLGFGMVAECFDAVLLAVVIFSGILPWLHSMFEPLSPQGTWDDALFLVAAGILVSIPGLPFDWWSQFRLEERHGFNKSTQGLWVSDKLKAGLLACAIGFPLLWALLSLVRIAGSSWWIWGFALLMGFQLTMMILYPKLILPLFNRLSPLPEGELRTRLMQLADRTGFRARTIEVIDGSKRSGHSNAFFTGFGRFRRIVLFDTLLNQLSHEETEAVLAHEIGHYRRGHIPRMIAISAVIQFAGLWVIARLAESAWFNPAFGLPAGGIAPAFLLFALMSGLVTFWFTPIMNLLSRRHEYEADAFARDAMGGPGALISALRRLSQKNLTNLTPHPWYSGFHYSHPTLIERERALSQEPPSSRAMASPIT